MLGDDRLATEVRRLAGVNRRLPVLLLLAHVTRPARTRSIIEKGQDIGFRKVRDWNVTDVLQSADRANLVARVATGWQLLEAGFAALKLAGVDLEARPVPKPSD